MKQGDLPRPHGFRQETTATCHPFPKGPCVLPPLALAHNRHRQASPLKTSWINLEGAQWGRAGEGWSVQQWTPHSSVPFSRSVVSSSLRPHGLQPTPRAYSNSCPSSQWCHPTISFSVVPFSSHLQSFPASRAFQMSQFFTWGGQSFGVSSSASVLTMNIQNWFPLGWTGWISLQSKGLSRVFSNTTVQKYQFFSAQLSLQFNSHIHPWVLEKTTALTRRTFVGKVMSLLFNILSRFVIAFLPRSKCLLIHGCSHHLQWFWSPRK